MAKDTLLAYTTSWFGGKPTIDTDWVAPASPATDYVRTLTFAGKTPKVLVAIRNPAGDVTYMMNSAPWKMPHGMFFRQYLLGCKTRRDILLTILFFLVVVVVVIWTGMWFTGAFQLPSMPTMSSLWPSGHAATTPELEGEAQGIKTAVADLRKKADDNQLALIKRIDTTTTTPALPDDPIVGEVKAKMKQNLEKAMTSAKAAYLSARTAEGAAKWRLDNLEAAKSTLGAAWCTENEEALKKGQSEFAVASQQLGGLSLQIYLLDDQLKNGGASIVMLQMAEAINMQVANLEMKLQATATELKSDIKGVKTAVADLSRKVDENQLALIKRIDSLESTLTLKISLLLKEITSIPGQTAADIADLSKLVDTVKAELLKHKDNPGKIAAIELRLKELAKEVTEKLSAPAPAPVTPVAPAKTPTPLAPVTLPCPPVPLTQCYGPRCQPQQFAQPQYGWFRK